jgi:3-dehydroquinate dehydratase/shikimate dehydrogenase
MTINTKRLILRSWTEEDLEPFAQLNAITRVREYFPGLLSRQESDVSVKSLALLNQRKSTLTLPIAGI